MLAFFILLTFLRTLQGASAPPSHASSSGITPNVFVATACECPVAPEDGGQQFRTVFSILQSCFFTIFACVWTSAHPNINGPRDSDWTCLKRKVVTMLLAVIAPELVLLWALRQRLAAKEIAEKYNEEVVGFQEPKKSLWEEVVDWFMSLRGKVVARFRPLLKETTWRGNGQLWTTTHGFFIQMGGFILYDKGYPKEVLDYKRLAELLQKKAIDAPTVTERDLQDRSKSDAISKAILVLQTAWFVLQCIARREQRLPLSELEVLTLAFAVVNMAIYAVWWGKPQGVGMAICVPLKSPVVEINATTTVLAGDEQCKPEDQSYTELASLPQVHYRNPVGFENSPLILPPELGHDKHICEKHSWLRRMLHKDREKYNSPVFFLFRLPYRIVGSVIRTLRNLAGSNVYEMTDLRVPMFYASDAANDGTVLASSVIGTIFGAIHLLAWASEFPSLRDHVLWRVSAIVLTVVPFLILLVFALTALEMEMIGEFAVIIIALLAIHNPPHDVLLDVSWTSYIPHF